MSNLNFGVLLFHDGEGYVAQVIEYPECIGKGFTRGDALRRAELAMMQVGNQGMDMQTRPVESERSLRACRKITMAKQMLLDKFGKSSNRELAARIGIVERDAPVMLSMALNGHGSRRVRCAVALALGIKPSLIWPDRPSKISTADDAEFRHLENAISNTDTLQKREGGANDLHKH